MAAADLVGERCCLGSDEFVAGADDEDAGEGGDLEGGGADGGRDGEFGGFELLAVCQEGGVRGGVAAGEVDELVGFGGGGFLKVCGAFDDVDFLDGDDGIASSREYTSGHDFDAGVGVG